MNKEEFLKERGYDVRQMLCFFSNYLNYKRMREIDYTIAEVIVEKPSEEEIKNIIDKSYEIVKRDRS